MKFFLASDGISEKSFNRIKMASRRTIKMVMNFVWGGAILDHLSVGLVFAEFLLHVVS